MKTQNILKIIAAMLFAVVPFVLSANPEKVEAKSIAGVGTAEPISGERVKEKIREINRNGIRMFVSST